MDQSNNGYSIDQWCAKYGISRGTWYNLVKAGKAPGYLLIGSRIVIPPEADAEYQREKTAAAVSEQAARSEKRRTVRANADATKAAARDAAKASVKKSLPRVKPKGHATHAEPERR